MVKSTSIQRKLSPTFAVGNGVGETGTTDGVRLGFVVAVGEGSAKVAVGGTVAVDDGDGEAVAFGVGDFVADGTSKGVGLDAVGADVAVEKGNGEGEGVALGTAIDARLISS